MRKAKSSVIFHFWLLLWFKETYHLQVAYKIKDNAVNMNGSESEVPTYHFMAWQRLGTHYEWKAI
jgi:hypothetical protein